MEDSRPIFSYTRFSYNENALYTCKRLQIPPKASTDAFGEPPLYIPHTRAQKWSAARLFAAVSALHLRSLPSSRHLAISPLRRACHTTTSSSSPHRHALSSTRAPHPLLLWARTPHPPLFLPPPLPLSLRPRAASAPFFAPLPPPIRTPCKSRCTHVRYFPPCVPRPSPFPPPGPCRVFTHLLLHLPASAVDFPLCVAARRVLCLFDLLTIA